MTPPAKNVEEILAPLMFPGMAYPGPQLGYKLRARDQQRLDAALKAIDALVLDAVPEKRKGELRQVPCPDGKPGCLVMHYGNDVIKSERDHGYNQAIADFRERWDTIRGGK